MSKRGRGDSIRVSRISRVTVAASACTSLLLIALPAFSATSASALPVPGDGASAINLSNPPDRANLSADAQPAADATASSPISLSVVSTTPVAPPAQTADTTVTVVLSVTNDTDDALQQVQLRGVRDSPIIRQSALDSMLAHPSPPADSSLTQSLVTTKYSAAVAAHSSVQFTYQFPASTIRLSGGVCLCQSGIYPIDVSAYAVTASRTALTQIGWAQTYLVSVASTPASEQVSWLWPLLDRPHQLSDNTPFIDDDLAGEVSSGGRLDRALHVLEQLGPDSADSKVTVVIDPELIDELEQMATGYRVQTGVTSVAGTGSAAAADWLRRLRSAIAGRPIALTAYGDPAVDAAAAAHLTPSTTMPATMARRVQLALGRSITPADSALAWPPDETLTAAGLSGLVDAGTTTVVVNDATLPGRSSATAVNTAVASLPGASAGSATVTALVTSAALEQRVDTMLNSGGPQLAGLPALLAELALRTLPAGAGPSYVVLTPDRYVDPNPATAVALINATSTSSWSSPIAALAAAATITPTDHGTLTPPAPAQYGGSAALIGLASSTTAFVTNFATVLDPADAATLLADFPMAIQLCQSAAWAADPNAAAAFGGVLTARQSQLTDQVQIVRPSNGSYSLASSSSPLLVTVSNNLSVPVTVRVAVTSVGGVAGFRTDNAGAQTIPANSRRTIKLQAHVARSGHFRVQAQLLMPSGATIGSPLALSIYSSALGTIGVVITVVAAAVLLLALVYRFARRWRHHRDLIRRMMADEQRVLAGARG